jgi:hypothetical protein
MLSRRPRRFQPTRRWPVGRWTVTAPATNPRDSWPPSADSDRWTASEPEETGPTVDHGSAPSRWSEAFYTAFTLALSGEDPGISADLTASEQRAFEVGAVAGARAYDKRVDERFAGRVTDGYWQESNGFPRDETGMAPGYTS